MKRRESFSRPMKTPVFASGHPVPNTVPDVIDAILSLPLVVKLWPEKSLAAWLATTGYAALADAVDEAAIRSALRQRSGTTKAWLLYSKHKTADWGWYCEPDGDGNFLVGRRDEETRSPDRFADEVAATAALIKRELEAIRSPS